MLHSGSSVESSYPLLAGLHLIYSQGVVATGILILVVGGLDFQRNKTESELLSGHWICSMSLPFERLPRHCEDLSDCPVPRCLPVNHPYSKLAERFHHLVELVSLQ